MLGEAVERFVWRRLPGRHDIRRSAPADLPDAVLDLDALAGYSGDLRRSDQRLQWAVDTPFHWIRGGSLTAGTPVWVPLQLVSADGRCHDEPELRPRVTTGIAAHPDRDAAILNAEGQKQSVILNAEGDRQANILKAEGEREAQRLRAEGFSVALNNINEAAQNVDGKTMSLQYLEALKFIGASPSTKYIFPMEFTSLLSGFVANKK